MYKKIIFSLDALKQKDYRFINFLGSNEYQKLVNSSPQLNNILAMNDATYVSANVCSYINGIDRILGHKKIPDIQADIHPRHTENVARVGLAIAQAMGLSLPEQRIVWYGHRLHDIGKTQVSDDLLLVKRGLTLAEALQIKKPHAVKGARIIRRLGIVEAESQVALFHHEDWNGGGYFGLRGAEIPRPARICHVADVYDVLANIRDYARAESKDPLTPEAAVAHLITESGTAFDPEVIEGLKLWEKRGFPDPDMSGISLLARVTDQYDLTNIEVAKKLLYRVHHGVTDFFCGILDLGGTQNQRGYNPYIPAYYAVHFCDSLSLSPEETRAVYLYCLVGGLYDMYLPASLTEVTQFIPFAHEFDRDLFDALFQYRAVSTVNEDFYENWNGVGSLCGKQGTDINYLSRVARVIAVYTQYGLAELVARRGVKLDPELVDAFLKILPHAAR